ncbi:MAG: DNA primase, partial [Verrucomicrobiales bacterium]
KTQRIPEPQLIQAGLDRQRQENDPSAGCYDRFRNRVIFPICNDQGSPIAFSGRALTDEPNQPKYLNSPETPLFTKSRVLFGLNRSKRAMLDQDRALLLEGQVDLITCHQFGFENAVAPQGTAFTSDQAKILRRYVAEVVLCFDSDHAGQEAALKAIPLLLQANLSAKVMRLPAGEDPDSLLRTHGAEPFAKLQAEAVEFPEFLVQHYRETLDLESGRDKMRFVEKVSPILQLVSNAVLKEMAIARWSEALSLPASVFRTPTKAGKVDNQAPRASTSTSVDRTPRAFVRPDGCIHRLTFLAYRSSDARQWLREREVYQVLQNEPGAKILESILLSEIQGDDPASLDALAGEMPVSGAGRYLSELRQAPLPKEVIDAVAHSNEGLQIKIRLQAAEARVTDALQETVPNHQRIAAARQELLDLRRQHKHFGGA